MKIVGLAYKKGVGKNTTAKFMTTLLRCENPGLKIMEVSFAGKLKDICYQLYSWAGLKRGIYYESHREEKEVILPELGKSPRQIWIEVGNKLREVDPDIWINFALKGAKADIIIITDVRFRNEAQAIRNNGGILLKIDRPSIEQGTDPAEVDLDSWTDWDCVIDNIGSLKNLNEQATILVRGLI